MKFAKLALIASFTAMLAACGPENVPQDAVDNNQGISRNNAQKNANSWYSQVYPEGVTDVKLGKPFRVLMDSDSTIGSSCRYGDGWASGKVQFEAGGSLNVKCQTNGTGKGINGCMFEKDFVTKPYKDEDKTCQNLTKLDKF